MITSLSNVNVEVNDNGIEVRWQERYVWRLPEQLLDDNPFNRSGATQ